jgi:hypothetical protein
VQRYKISIPSWFRFDIHLINLNCEGLYCTKEFNLAIKHITDILSESLLTTQFEGYGYQRIVDTPSKDY